MGENKHTFEELKQWQCLSLDVKILMTKDRIRQWINYYGEDGGLGYKDVIDWMNENGNINIIY